MIETEELKKVVEKIKEKYELYKEKHKKSMSGKQFKDLVKTLMKMNKIDSVHYKQVLSLLRKKEEDKIQANNDLQKVFHFENKIPN